MALASEAIPVTEVEMPVLIEAVNLHKVFQTPVGEVHAVNGLTLNVSSGEVFGLLGANGAGKTTTLRMILGLMPPSSGTVSVAGFDVATQAEQVKRSVALVSASAGLYQWLSPRELMLYFADLYDVAEDAANQRVEELADLFDLRSFIDRPCAGLSTGQQQRVNLARSLMHDPPVVLMDEPTRGLDIVGSKRIFDFTARLKEIGKAVIFCTHRLEEAQRLCDRFGLMFRGRLQLQGTLAELRQQSGRDSITDMFLDLMEEQQATTEEAMQPLPEAPEAAVIQHGGSSA
ncbi:MAG TPA: ATP-binding cassette domain-containing protein [Planctomycetaceae bacterium]|nr:ATP-binding cassette domain-containing protein [Planctomycetaceae bacterium]HQZ65076.1 ATP-binding cassette domain-containing protein [Planctomycetaceae bacterium]HRA87369.1 ATP-binding cassette domain-containing protein [Planctomycetaceae bacterium]